MYFNTHLIPLDDSYQILNENQEIIECQVYVNKKTVKGEAIKELIFYFPKLVHTKFITVAIPPKLIGIPDGASQIKVFKNYLYLPQESMIFMPVNEGIEKVITSYFVSDSLIHFNTFGNLKSLGGRIYISKKITIK